MKNHHQAMITINVAAFLLVLLLGDFRCFAAKFARQSMYRRAEFDRLHEAIINYDEARAFHLIEYDFHRNVNAQNGTGWAPIHVAAFAGSEVFAAFLIDHRANLRATTNEGLDAIHIAVVNNRLSFVQFLVRSGKELAKDLCCSPANKTISHLAAEYDVSDFPQIMRDEFNLTVLDGFHQMPLCWAARNGSVEFARKLFDDPLYVDAMKAIMNEPVCVYENGSDQIMVPLLHIAVFYQQLPFVQFLLSKQANYTKIDTSGLTAVHAIAKQTLVNDTKIAINILAELHERGADIEARDAIGRTPYLTAIQYDSLQMAQILSEQFGANSSAVDNLGFTAFHLAETPESVDYLANATSFARSYKKEINRKTRPACPPENQLECQRISGMTPLLLAVTFKRDVRFIKYLVEHGADPYATNDEKQNVLHLAIDADHFKALRYFVAESFSNLTEMVDSAGRTALFYAVELNKTEAVLTIVMAIDRGSAILNVKAVKVKHFTPMHMAIRAENAKALEVLIKSGASFHEIASDGRSPIHEAVAHRKVAMVRKIVELTNATYLNITDRLGRSALHLCITNVKDDYLVAKSLLQYSTPEIINSVDLFGDTALQRAIYHESVDVVRLFLEHNASCALLDAQDRSPLMLAKQINNEDLIEAVAQYCKEIGANCTTALCEKTCSHTPIVSNGQVNNGFSTVGAVRKFKCDLGFVSEGSTTVKCGPDGRWVINGHCRKACKPKLEMDNGVVDAVDKDHGMIRCSAGYKLHGHNVAHCTHDGRWEVSGKCQSAVPDYFEKDYFLKWNTTGEGHALLAASSHIQAILAIQDEEHPYEPASIIVITHQGQVTALARSNWSAVEWHARVSLDDIYVLHAVYDTKEDEIYLTNYGNTLGQQIYRVSRWSLMTAESRFEKMVPLEPLVFKEQTGGRRFRGLAIDNDARLLYACDYDGGVNDISIWMLLPIADSERAVAKVRRTKLVGSLRFKYAPMFCSFYTAPRETAPLLLRRDVNIKDDDLMLLAVSDHNNNRIELLDASYEQIILAARQVSGVEVENASSTAQANNASQVLMASLFQHVTLVTEIDNKNPSKSGSVYCPNELAFDPLGNLFVADNCNYRIQVFQLHSSGNLWSPMRVVWGLNSTMGNIYRMRVARNPTTQKLVALANYGGNRLVYYD